LIIKKINLKIISNHVPEKRTPIRHLISAIAQRHQFSTIEMALLYQYFRPIIQHQINPKLAHDETETKATSIFFIQD